MGNSLRTWLRSTADVLGRIGGDASFWTVATLVFLVNAGLSAVWGQWPLAGFQAATALIAVISASAAQRAHRQGPADKAG